MRKKSRKLIYSVFGLIIAFAVAVMSSYAWISMNSTTTIEGFNIDIGNNKKLLISFTGEEGTFKAYMTSAEIQNYLKSRYGENYSLYPAQSRDGKSIVGIDGGEADYISFDLYFQSNVKADIFLDPNPSATYVSSTRKSGSSVGYVRAWYDIIKDTYGQHPAIASGEEIVAEARNAVRISFVSGENSVIWYPNPDKGYNKDVNTFDEQNFEIRNLALEYMNEVYGYDLTVPEYYLDKNFSTNFYNTQTGNYIITDRLVSLEYDEDMEAYVGCLKINIWLEGWDGDCFDSILEDRLSVGLQFTSITVPHNPEEPEEPEEPDYTTWQYNVFYAAGTYVIHNNKIFYAREGNMNLQPGIVGLPWQEVTNEWRSFNVYKKGDRVIHMGREFEAREDTSNETPGVVDMPWQELTDEWRSFNVYNEGDCVIHNGKQYRATGYTMNQTPGITGPWELIG